MMTTQSGTSFEAYHGGGNSATPPYIVGNDTSNATNNIALTHINYNATKQAPVMLIDDDKKIFLTNVISGRRKLIISPPLIITPSYDKSLRLYTYEDNQLGISVFAETMDYFNDDLREQLFVLWDVYALEGDPNRLTDKARKLQIALLRRFKEIV